MAFCTSCGAAMEPTAKFCTSCGTTVPQTAAPAPAASTSAPAGATAPAQGSNVFKIVLIVLGVVFAIALLGVALIGYGAYRVAKDVRVEESGGTTRVETPMGTIEADKGGSASAIAEKMGVPVYPGATPMEGNATVRVGGKTIAAANFETDDSPGKVFEFYKEQYPEARMVSQQDEEYHLMTGDDHEAVNIHIREEGGRTQISISKFGGE